MSGNTFGELFKVTTYGESHGKALGCIIDGCPPNIELNESDIQHELNRRKPGQSDVTTQRKEDDLVEILGFQLNHLLFFGLLRLIDRVFFCLIHVEYQIH